MYDKASCGSKGMIFSTLIQQQRCFQLVYIRTCLHMCICFTKAVLYLESFTLQSCFKALVVFMMWSTLCSMTQVFTIVTQCHVCKTSMPNCFTTSCTSIPSTSMYVFVVFNFIAGIKKYYDHNQCVVYGIAIHGGFVWSVMFSSV